MKIKQVIMIFFIYFLITILTSCQISINTKETIAPKYEGIEVISQEKYSIKLSNLSNQNNDEIKTKIEKDLGLEIEETLDFYLAIRLSNPDKYKIDSLVLSDGTLYSKIFTQSDFTEESDFENIYLKINSGDKPGIKVYTVLKMEYQDKGKLKEIKIEGKDSVKIGVTYDSLPVLNVEPLTITRTSASFSTIIIKDGENPCYFYLFLFVDNDISSKKYIPLANEIVELTNLKSNTIYQYVLVCLYDLLDGEGTQLIILDKSTFKTKNFLTPTIKIVDVNRTETRITFDVDVDDEDQVGNISAIELFHGDNLIASLSNLTEREFSNLLPDSEYTIKVTYAYDLNDGLGIQKTYASRTLYSPVDIIDFTSAENFYNQEDIIKLNLNIYNPFAYPIQKIYLNNEVIDVLDFITTGYIELTGFPSGVHEISITGFEYVVVMSF